MSEAMASRRMMSWRKGPFSAFWLSAALLVSLGFSAPAQGIPPTVRPFLGFRRDAWGDVLAPLLAGREGGEGGDFAPMVPPIPLRAQVALARAWTFDAGAKASLLGSWSGEAEAFWLLAGEAGLSWWPFDSFGTGPVLGAAAWSRWALSPGEAAFIECGLRVDAGVNLSLGRAGSLYSGLAFKAPIAGGGSEMGQDGTGGVDLAFAWMVML